MKLPNFVQPHEATITPYEGEGAYGPVWGDDYDAGGYIQQTREIILDDEGNEIVSQVQFYTSEDISPKPQSELEYNGNTYEVISVATHDNALTGKTSHVEIHLR